ncbi:unnamed protein product [Cochlearia groenlandica]
MVQYSSILKFLLVLVTIASICSTFVEANRGFSWGWGGGATTGSTPASRWGWDFNRNGSTWGQSGGSNYSSGSGSSPGSGWGWASSRNGSSWGWGWGWGGIPNNTHNSGSDGSKNSGSNHDGSTWGWGSGGISNNTNNPGFGSNHSGSNWGWGLNNTYNPGNGGPGSRWRGHSKNYNATYYNGPRKIIVGGDKEWTYGFNYADWASKTAPFFLNDILVFKYNPPAPFTHSVYLLQNPSSYAKCDVKKGKMIASPKQGVGNGFEFVLTKMKPYYFSCGEHEGAHCNNGTMKFTIRPIFPSRW